MRYIFNIKNNGSSPSTFTLFGAVNAGKPNFGNPAGIEITYGHAAFSYIEAVTGFCGRPVVIKNIYCDKERQFTVKNNYPQGDLSAASFKALPFPQIDPNQTKRIEAKQYIKIGALTTLMPDGWELGANECISIEIEPLKIEKPATQYKSNEDSKFEKSRPYIFIAVNNTNDNVMASLAKVTDNNCPYFIRYGYPNFSHEEFIAFMKFNVVNVGRVRIDSQGLQEGYKAATLESTIYEVKYARQGSSGTIQSNAIEFRRDSSSTFGTFAAVNCDFVLCDKWDVAFNLLPKQIMTIFLYPIQVNKTKFELGYPM